MVVLCRFASADTLFTDDGMHVSGYLLPLSGSGGGNSSISSWGNAGTGVMGLAYDYQTNALLASVSGNNAIYAYSSTGVQTVFASSASIASLTDPIGIAVDSSGDVFVGADGGTEIDEIKAGGSVETFGSGLNVESLTIGPDGNLYEADGTKQVNEFTNLSGTPTESTYASLGRGGDFNGLAFDTAGDLYVSYWSGTNAGGIYEIAAGSGGAVTTFYTETGFKPVALAYSPDNGNLYMSYIDSGGVATNGGVDVFGSVAGGKVASTESTFVSAGNLDMPYGLAIASPEPGTWMMLATGLLAVSFGRMRRVRQ